MSKHLHLAEGVALPLEAVTEKLAFLGRTGSGKTYAAMKLAELMLDAGAQVGAIDPVGVWRALRVPAEKSGKAFEVIVFGGLYGDLPLEPSAGAFIADVVCDRGISFVLDVSQWISNEQQRFVKDFIDRFFSRRKAAPAAIHFFIEECQEFCPQNPQGLEAMTLHAFQRFWKLGRNFGIGGSLISQRPQEISKKTLNMSGTLFAFQMTGPQERKAIKDWVADQGIASDIESVLQKLETGQPHVESPTFLKYSGTVRILPRVTADLSSTPKVGAATAAKRPLTPIDVEQLKAAMAETLERAKQDDPKELKKQLADLGKKLKDKEYALSVATAGQQALAQTRKGDPVPVWTDADREVAGNVAKVIRERVGEAEQLLARAEDRLNHLVKQAVAGYLGIVRQASIDASFDLEKALDRASVKRTLEKLELVSAPAVRMTIHPNNVAPATKAALVTVAEAATRAVRVNGVRPAAIGAGAGDPSVGNSGLRRMLIALAQRPSLNRRQLGVRAGLSSRSGTFDTYLSRARQSGWVEGSQELRLTDAGVSALGAFDPLPEGDELLRYWLTDLGESGAARILRSLAAAYPKALTRSELGEAAGLSDRSGTFDTYLSRLRTLELVQGRGELRASEELFG